MRGGSCATPTECPFNNGHVLLEPSSYTPWTPGGNLLKGKELTFCLWARISQANHRATLFSAGTVNGQVSSQQAQHTTAWPSVWAWGMLSAVVHLAVCSMLPLLLPLFVFSWLKQMSLMYCEYFVSVILHCRGIIRRTLAFVCVP